MKRKLYGLIFAALLLFGTGRLLAQTDTQCPEVPIADAAGAYYAGLGQARYNTGEFTKAVLDYTCAINAQPDYAPAYAGRGYAYTALGDSDHALADYNKAIELDETLTTAYTNRGSLYTRLGNFGLAINDFALVIGLKPDDAIAYNNRGVVHAAEGNYDLAIADFQQAIDIDPNYATPYASLGAVYSAMAAQNYQQFVKMQGENARLPAGTPNQVLTAVDDSLRTGDFSVWLALLSPAQ
jgi:tetratricopeptide (TPR) repeat protein